MMKFLWMLLPIIWLWIASYIHYLLKPMEHWYGFPMFLSSIFIFLILVFVATIKAGK